MTRARLSTTTAVQFDYNELKKPDLRCGGIDLLLERSARRSRVSCTDRTELRPGHRQWQADADDHGWSGRV
jgi:hypothetical protein